MAYLCRQGEHRSAVSWNDNLSWMNSPMTICLRPPPPDKLTGTLNRVPFSGPCYMTFTLLNRLIPHKCVSFSLIWDVLCASCERRKAPDVSHLNASRQESIIRFHVQERRNTNLCQMPTSLLPQSQWSQTLCTAPQTGALQERANFQTLTIAAKTSTHPSLGVI